MMREISRMSYLWRVPHRIDGTRLTLRGSYDRYTYDANYPAFPPEDPAQIGPTVLQGTGPNLTPADADRHWMARYTRLFALAVPALLTLGIVAAWLAAAGVTRRRSRGSPPRKTKTAAGAASEPHRPPSKKPPSQSKRLRSPATQPPRNEESIGSANA